MADGAARLPFVHTADESRKYIMEYSRSECETNAAKPRLPYRETFLKALQGDAEALRVVFTDENYHTNDQHWGTIPWHILQVVGDRRYAAFVNQCTPGERRAIIAATPASIGQPEQERAFDQFFRSRFPQTYALWKKYGPFVPAPEVPGVDYGVRHLSEALQRDPRFTTVRLHKKSDGSGMTVIVAPRTLSKSDIAALRKVVTKHIGKKGELLIDSGKVSR